MRRFVRADLALGVVALLAGAAFAQPASAPVPKAGLWDQQLTVDDGSYKIPPNQMCVDAASARRMSLVGAQMDRTRCATYQVQARPQGGFSFRSVCALAGGAEATTEGEITGDLQSRYVVRATGTTRGAPQPMQNGTHVVTLESVWRGPCPVGQSGGDMTSGGKTANVFAPRG